MTDIERLTEDIHALVPIVGRMGIEVVEVPAGEDATAAVRLPAEPNVNHFGALYAGSLFTAAELLGGVLARTALALEGFVPLVKSMSIDFRRPALSAVVARATMTAAERTRILDDARATGKAEWVLVAELTGEDGTVVATTRATYQLRRF